MANVSTLTSHFTTAQEGFTTTLASSVSAGAVTVSFNSLAGYADGDFIALVVDPGQTSEQVVMGTVSGTTLVNCTWTEGTNQAHAAGATAADYVSASQQSAQTKGTLTTLNQNGTLRTGIVSTAAIANGAVTNDKLGSAPGEAGGPWLTWTPTWANASIGNGTVNAYYTKIGKTVRFRLTWKLGSTSTAGTVPTFSLPLPAVSTYDFNNSFIGSGSVRDDSNNNLFPAATRIFSATTAINLVSSTSGGYTLANAYISTVPVPWAVNDVYTAEGTYEAA